jgi:ribonucleoside-diphosphate reductase beta chain
MSVNPSLLDPGMDLTLRPLRYPQFYDRFRDAIKNTWTVEEVDLHTDLADLAKLTPAERHLVSRLVAFFATGDTIVANNLVLNLYQHVNCPEGRLYLSRQLFEEAVHVQFYLTLLDTYVPDEAERSAAFAAIENIPSIKRKADFCFTWIDSLFAVRTLRTREDRRAFLLNLICFAACIEGLFFYGAFAYVYFLRSRGLLHGLASGTNWVFRDESMHMAFAFDVVATVRQEEPDLFDEQMAAQVSDMLAEAVDCEAQFAEDLLGQGVAGLPLDAMRQYLEHVADRRLAQLGIPPKYGSSNPLTFMDLQDVQELSNFFERRVSAYQVAVSGSVSFDEEFLQRRLGPAPGERAAVAAELGDDFVAAPHGDVVDPAAAKHHALLGARGEQVAFGDRGQERDAGRGGDGDRPVRVAGAGERGVGEQEHVTAVAHRVAVHHRAGDPHARDREPLGQLDQFDAQ